jgi:hypothetical protein
LHLSEHSIKIVISANHKEGPLTEPQGFKKEVVSIMQEETTVQPMPEQTPDQTNTQPQAPEQTPEQTPDQPKAKKAKKAKKASKKAGKGSKAAKALEAQISSLPAHLQAKLADFNPQEAKKALEAKKAGLSAGAKKAWETRRANGTASDSAKKAWETRKAFQAILEAIAASN